MMDENTNKYYLHPGVIFVENRAYIVETVLGSCVSVCLWDSYTKIGGINHFLLPLWNGEGLPIPKFGNIAIDKLIERMVAIGSNINNISAKIFGGASVLQNGASIFSVGHQNITVAQDNLDRLNIKIIASSVGGERGRFLKFHTNTGEVFMRFVKNQNIDFGFNLN